MKSFEKMSLNSRVLCTFSGKTGDILWSMPTVREIAKLSGTPTDFCCMPQYENLLPLLNEQSYIRKAFILPTWQFEGSPHGDQPWQPPTEVERGYDRVWHLTYTSHPQTDCLMDFTAGQAGVRLPEKPLPFIEVPEEKPSKMVASLRNTIAFAFNEMAIDVKKEFIQEVGKQVPECSFIDTTQFSWKLTAFIIKHSLFFIGCRSSNYVLAHGLNKRVLCFEPNPSRGAQGPWARVFGCKYGRESNFWNVQQIPEAVAQIKYWLQEIKEIGE